MIGINTNILLRLWLDDDPAQSKRIDHLLAEHGGLPGSLQVTDVVLAEAVWTLRSAFEPDKHAQLIAVRSLLEKTAFAFEEREAVADALRLFEAGSCGFADCLVIAKHARHGCDFTATLDRGMRKLPGGQGALTSPGQARDTEFALQALSYSVAADRFLTPSVQSSLIASDGSRVARLRT